MLGKYSRVRTTEFDDLSGVKAPISLLQSSTLPTHILYNANRLFVLSYMFSQSIVVSLANVVAARLFIPVSRERVSEMNFMNHILVVVVDFYGRDEVLFNALVHHVGFLQTELLAVF